jgi:phosphate starvation-inducible PhoH-like protein
LPEQTPRTLEFEDNRVVAEIVGPYSRNLADIERAFDIEIHHRGNVLSLIGEDVSVARGIATLRALETRLSKGRAIEAGDVAGAIRFAREEGAPVAPQRADERSAKPAPVAAKPPGMTEIHTRKRVIEPRSPRQATYIDALLNDTLTFGIGPAGTGKSYLAVAAGVAAFMEKRVDRIVLSRPAVEAGERLGFLPGDMKEKVDPYLRPLYDALHDTLGGDQVTKFLESGVFEVAPLAFMRGRTLSNAFVVLDEAQNCTRMQMKMFLTRLGENSQMAVTGDPTQVDLPRGEKSGLQEAVDILEGIPDATVVRFTDTDVVRHPMVARIVKAYDKLDAGRSAHDRR